MRVWVWVSHVCVFMCLSTCMCLCVCCMCVYLCVCVCACMHCMYMCVCVCVSVSTCVCAHVSMSTYIYMCVYTYVYGCMWLGMHTYAILCTCISAISTNIKQTHKRAHYIDTHKGTCMNTQNNKVQYESDHQFIRVIRLLIRVEVRGVCTLLLPTKLIKGFLKNPQPYPWIPNNLT